MRLPTEITAWAAPSAKAKLEKIKIPLPEVGRHDVLLRVLSCGICHSDLHLIDNDWGFSTYPLVPGHEIIGQVIAKGSDVKFPIETILGVGWQRSACGDCDECLSSKDNMCVKKTATCVGNIGGYADYHVADSRYCFPMPNNQSNPAQAPLLCGGATVFSPLNHFVSALARTARVGIVGLGGLGHLGVKMADRLGYHVTLFSSSPAKSNEAKKLGADRFISSTDAREIEKLGRDLDLILVTANVDLPWSSYLKILRTDGTLAFVGIPPSPMNLNIVQLLDQRLRIAASPIAARIEIQRMIQFCDQHQIESSTETFSFSDVNAAIAKVREGKVRYRAVLAN